MTTDDIRRAVLLAAEEYPISRATLFGSRANGTATEDSDVDLIMEFNRPVSLLKLAALTDRLESLLHTSVDLIHGPLRPTDLLVVDKEVLLYAS